ADADVFRRVGQQASGMMRRLHDYLYRIPLPRRPVDLNAVVADALDRLPGGGDGVERDLAPSLPPAVRHQAPLGRLGRLLVGSAGGVLDASGGGTVTVRTRAEGGKVSLRVEDDGPSVSDDDPGRVFEPFVVGREGENSLELAACQGVVRKLEATMRAEN